MRELTDDRFPVSEQHLRLERAERRFHRIRARCETRPNFYATLGKRNRHGADRQTPRLTSDTPPTRQGPADQRNADLGRSPERPWKSRRLQRRSSCCSTTRCGSNASGNRNRQGGDSSKGNGNAGWMRGKGSATARSARDMRPRHLHPVKPRASPSIQDAHRFPRSSICRYDIVPSPARAPEPPLPTIPSLQCHGQPEKPGHKSHE